MNNIFSVIIDVERAPNAFKLTHLKLLYRYLEENNRTIISHVYDLFLF